MATMLGFIAIVAIGSQLSAQVTRREIFFGVTVSPAFREGPVARSISRRYALEIWLLAAAAAALVVTAPMPVVSGPMLLAQTLGASVAFAKARSAARPHAVAPATLREAEVGPRPGLPGGLAGQMGPFLILLVAAIYVGVNWEHVPEKFPTHWNLAGTPDGWTRKTVQGVFRGFSVGAIACAMMLFTSYVVLHRSRLPRVTGRDGEQSRRVRQINLVATLASEYLIALLISWAAVIAMFAEGRPHLPLAFRIAPFAVFFVGTLAIRVTRRVAITDGPPVGDSTPDSGWYFGQIYVNRADPALFVERRMGLGYTLNLGNLTAWLVMIGFLSALAIPLFLVP